MSSVCSLKVCQSNLCQSCTWRRTSPISATSTKAVIRNFFLRMYGYEFAASTNFVCFWETGRPGGPYSAGGAVGGVVAPGCPDTSLLVFLLLAWDPLFPASSSLSSKSLTIRFTYHL